MSHQLRSWTAALAVIMGLTAVPAAFVTILTPAVSSADVCASVGRRVSVSGCANLADAVAPYVPPPAYYAPLPDDPPPPPYYVPPPPPPPPPPYYDPTPNVAVCANVGRRVSVSGCV